MREKTPTDFVKRGKQSRGRKQGRGQHNLYETSEAPQPPAALGQQWRRCSDHKHLVGAAMLHFLLGPDREGFGFAGCFLEASLRRWHAARVASCPRLLQSSGSCSPPLPMQQGLWEERAFLGWGQRKLQNHLLLAQTPSAEL